MDTIKQQKRKSGITLLETVIALAVWMILSVGLFLMWQHTANASKALFEKQLALESARISMDILIANIELSHNIRLATSTDGILRQIFLCNPEYPERTPRDFRFNFTHNPTYGSSFTMDDNNEVTAGIALIRAAYEKGSHISIEIHTDCPDPIIITGSVDVRHKNIAEYTLPTNLWSVCIP